MEINEKQIRKIIENQKRVYNFLIKLNSVFNYEMDIYEVLSVEDITEVIWEVYQIPKDDFPEYDPEKERVEGEYDFCADGLWDISYNYFEGNLSLDDYINELKCWSEEFRHIYVNQLAEGVKNAK